MLMYYGADCTIKDACGNAPTELKGDTLEKVLPGVGPGAREIKRCIASIGACRRACCYVFLCSPLPNELNDVIVAYLWDTRVETKWLTLSERCVVS